VEKEGSGWHTLELSHVDPRHYNPTGEREEPKEFFARKSSDPPLSSPDDMSQRLGGVLFKEKFWWGAWVRVSRVHS